MPKKTESIKNFLTAFANPDLAKLYNYNMEVQVNVAQDNGTPISEKSGYTGRMWRGFSDGIQVWKSFRIPWSAAADPDYKDTELTWNLQDHAEGIGMTGWDWVKKCSRWVAFDFDSIVGHSSGLTAIELQELTNAASQIPWITVRRSTSGQGLHFYVFLNNVPTANHTEHAALARSILGIMSATAGFNFDNKVDICGGNMWVWHRKTKGTNGFELIKPGEILQSIPPSWRDNISVVKGKRKKILPDFVEEQNSSLFEQLTGQVTNVKLDKEHKKLIDYLNENEASFWWDSDNHLLVCHTYDLKQAHSNLSLKGIFETLATGKERPDHNCFLYPTEYPVGSWVVRRFTPGVKEANTWFADSSGWTTCFYNREPTLAVAAKANDGVESEKGEYHFNEAETASTAAATLGASLNLPPWACNRKAILKPHKDGQRLIVSIGRESNDNPRDMQGWQEEKGFWKKIFNANLSQPSSIDTQNYDNIVRHLITGDGSDAGWVINTNNNNWHSEPLYHIRIALKSLGLSFNEIDQALGKCVLDSWTLVNKPFQSEYPGGREWNRKAVQLKYLPQQEEPFNHPNWDKLLNHIGQGLDDAVTKDGWCLANGVLTGADYLRLWIASLFQEPTKHLPYLFLYSPEQQTGKTSFHESLKLLITSSGYIDVKAALINQSGFNEEMANAVICSVDECDLRQNKQAYNRIKDWITGENILIHPKGRTPYMILNVAHFIQTGNNAEECPIISGDSRIIVVRVPPLEPFDLIPKDTLFKLLDKEATAFLGTIFKIEIPPCKDRLAIPVLETEEKSISASLNRNAVEIFIDEMCYAAPGETIKYSEFYTRFVEWLDPSEINAWSKIRVGRILTQKHPKGRLPQDQGQFHIANLSFEKPLKLKEHKYILQKDCLVLENS